MTSLFISLAAPVSFLIFLIGWSTYAITQIYSSFYGAPYIATENGAILDILKQVKLRRNMRMLELGCGDGRLLRTAVEHYGVYGHGVDINPVIIAQARARARHIDPSRINFEVTDIKNVDVSTYDVIYLFMLPYYVKNYAHIWKTHVKKGTLIISHAFVIHAWKKHLIHTLVGKKYNTYYYRMS